MLLDDCGVDGTADVKVDRDTSDEVGVRGNVWGKLCLLLGGVSDLVSDDCSGNDADFAVSIEGVADGCVGVRSVGVRVEI